MTTTFKWQFYTNGVNVARRQRRPGMVRSMYIR